MYKVPKEKSIQTVFGCTRKTATFVRRICHATTEATHGYRLADLIPNIPATNEYVNNMDHNPYLTHLWRTEIAMHAIDTLLGTGGVRCLYKRDGDQLSGVRVLYLDVGNSYERTLVYNPVTDSLRIRRYANCV